MKIINVALPGEDQTIVWRHHDSIYNYNGWPSVCRDDRGVLWAGASSFRIQHVDPNGKNCLFISKDEGKTWSCPMVVNDSYLDDRDTGIVSMGGGKMLMSWFSSLTNQDYAQNLPEGFDPRDKRIIKATTEVLLDLEAEGDNLEEGAYVKLSEDYGMTWSENIKVPMTAPHGPNVTKDGKLIYLGKDYEPGEDGESKVRFYTSDDGREWTKLADIPLPEGHHWYQFHEPHVAELPNGRLLGSIRVHGRPEAPESSCYITTSDDGGHTWTVPKFIGISGLPPHVLVHSSGAVILTYSCRDWDNKSERACVSYDNGETWTEDYVISDNVPFCDHGYPATCELSDGSLYTVYYQAYPGDSHTSLLATKWQLQK